MRAVALTKEPTRNVQITQAGRLAPVAEWIGAIFIAPLDTQAVDRMAAEHESGLFEDIGGILDCHQATSQMSDAILADGPGDISTRYVRLFDGVAGRRTVSLYESYYRSDGMRLFQSPVDEMNAVLRLFDMSIRSGCSEPPDHLSIELAALAAALRLGDEATAFALCDRLETWMPQLRARLNAEDPGGFYSAAAAVADRLIAEIKTDAQAVSQ
jgi:TorA-specific chaperone